MKAVLISIRPEWCEKIANGHKTIEVRKTKPKLETPFKCYIYCSWGKNSNVLWKNKTGDLISDHWRRKQEGWKGCCGKVIGEFVCDTFVTDKTFGHDALFNAAACISEVQAVEYADGSPLFGWNISNIVIYENPKELSDFLVERDTTTGCPILTKMNRPPQSWCYVEGVIEP